MLDHSGPRGASSWPVVVVWLHAAIVAAATLQPLHAQPVAIGLERVGSGEQAAPVGRVGLLAHGASVTLDGRHAIEVLRGRGVELVRLLTPEHGLRGEAAAGEPVPSGVDPGSGLPIVSLYGEKTRPDPADLAGLDVLVVDLQDAGVRFYTYASTMIHCLDAAAEAGIEVVVLDRPNPLGGERIEGPVADRRRVPVSLVNMTPGPLVHGLTLGELALLANHGRERPARLRVIPMRGWRRAMTWIDTGRPWTQPSPNLRSAEAALAYPAVALLEATNVSEGRGTAEPFLRLGAPWLDTAGAVRLQRVAAPGFELSPIQFTPRSSRAAPAPKHLDVECAGVEVQVTDPDDAEPYRLGLELLAALSAERGFSWRDDGAALSWLLGTPEVYAALSRGDSVAQIVARDRDDHAAWRLERRPFLLYD
ncbi:MAG TPA: DUF1343 domain-containing protein [Thermoanaerobaculia bacterium]|nr:DUF1343 domain-containing protein [Thermoanaerobaculia bacterium]